ncbi:MAG: AGE family epimerase/isomerase [Bacteroidaceae bacterium]|nr:AGE family epimerase/isomerase [Bacteroidaceae bacterium]
MFRQAKQEMREVLENNILSFWLTKMQDHENGGFYGQMKGDGTLVPTANKGGILNARILWSFSAAYRVLRKPEYLEAATRAKDYILTHFFDEEYGGTYWELDYLGRPVDTKKQFYALGFALYGLSEYVRATGDREALDYAIALFDTIEEHALDHEYNGYIEATTRDWQPIADMRLSDLDENYPKSQNTHLHIIEPYTNLLRCLQELHRAESCDYVPSIGAILPTGISVPQETIDRVAAAVRNLIGIFTDKILNPETHHLDLFFEMDWTRGAGQLESYGHDIECSWLMHEAALVLGDAAVLAKVEPIVRLVAKASEKGLNPDGSMLHEANVDTGHVDVDRHWWVQAENVVGWANLYQYFGDTDAAKKALRCWEYIKTNLIDREGGEWFWSRDPEGNINRKDDKAGFWKCPYHNSRMCLEIMERF